MWHKAREKHGIDKDKPFVVKDQLDAWKEAVEQAKDNFKKESVPQIQCFRPDELSTLNPGDPMLALSTIFGSISKQCHQQSLGPRGIYVDRAWADSLEENEYFALIHKPVDISKALKIPAARAAIDKEWEKLEKLPAWDYKSVREKADVKAEAKAGGFTVHFGNLMQLCHLKNSEMHVEFQSYKGRIVFRGDNIKDEDGCKALFTDQGTSSSHMTATKFLDIVSRLPGCCGEDSDATSAYTQIILENANKLLGTGAIPKTYVSLPRNKWPASGQI